MTIYILTILILFFFSLFEVHFSLTKEKRKAMLIITYFLLVFQMGLRWETGTDWNSYLLDFESMNIKTMNSILDGKFELGYSFLIWLIKKISSEYSLFLVIHALLFYGLIINSFKRYTSFLFPALLMFYTLNMGLEGSNRQLIALGVCLYAVRFVIQKKPIHFFVSVLIATLFHTSAILFGIYYFLNKKIKPLILIVVLGSAIIIGRTEIPDLLFSKFGFFLGGGAEIKVSIYLDSAKEILSNNAVSIIGLIKRVLFLIVFYLGIKRISCKNQYYNLMFNGYYLGIIFYFLFSKSLLIMISRGSMYFTIMEPLLLSSLIIIINKKYRTGVLFIFLVMAFLFFYQSINTYPDLFIPYKGIFINSDYWRKIY